MKYKEVEIIEEILKNLKPRRCLEWGAGYSTLYFPDLLTRDAIWTSIEHEGAWAEKIKDRIKRPGVDVFYIKPNHFPWTDKDNDGSYDDLRDYVNFPDRFGKFDFILVDGRARKECVAKAYKLVADNGVVVIHDANRVYYHEPFKLYKHQAMFRDRHEDGGGLWIGSKNLDIKRVVDVDRHVTLWRNMAALEKIFRI